MKIIIVPNESETPPGRLADAELHFQDGPLTGLKLVGFAIWERRTGGQYVTLPSRSFTVNGERRSFGLLRAIDDMAAVERLRGLVLQAYADATPTPAHVES